MTRRYWFILIIVPLLLTACAGKSVKQDLTVGSEAIPGQEAAVAGGDYVDINATDLQEMLKHKDFVFINVHIPFEGDIANTDLSIPYNEIDQQADQLPTNKDSRIVLYCRSGRMSSIAAETLVGMGYTHVANLEGGMLAWEQAGLPIEGK